MFFLLPSALPAQNSADIFIRTFATHDSILLRWIPANPETWRAGLQHGYLIERFSADEYLDLDGEDPTGKGTPVTDQPVLPLAKTDSAWNRLIREDKLNAFVYQCLYENKPATKTETQTQFGLALKACDLSVETAKAAGLFFIDRNIAPGQVYIYRIRLAVVPNGMKHAPGIGTADEKLSMLKAPLILRSDFRNKKAALTFEVASTREQYAGYVIERSEDSIHFQRMNSTLFVFARSQYEQQKTEAVYQDTIPQNNRTYWYHVRGYSYFGLEGPCSNVIHGKGHEEWNAYPQVDTIFSNDNKHVTLRWHIPGEKIPETLNAFCILRAPKAAGPFSAYGNLSPQTFSFTDQPPGISSYYMICAINENNDSAFSFPYLFQLRDDEPPPVPSHLSGMIDTNGVVHLSWQDVQAEDLKGYRIFRSNSLEEEWYEVGDSILPVNNFSDTISLQTLTKTIFYTVRSVDRMYNNSKNASPLLLRRPDKIPPVPPVVKFAVHTDSTIQLAWVNSSSDDVKIVQLFRSSASGEKIMLASWNGNDTVTHFTDDSLRPGTDYSYALSLSDSSGNRCNTAFPAIHFQPRVYPPLKNCSAIPDLEKRAIVLAWQSPAVPVNRVIIYKAKKGEALRSWETVSGNVSTVTDKELYPGNSYVYRIKAVTESGAETKPVEMEVQF